MLTHNPLAEMYGPHFLLLYFAVITLTLIACGWAVARLDTTDDRRLPLVPTQPDPLEIAYLRGSENEVLRVATFDLIQRGLLKVQEESKVGRLKVPVRRLVRADPQLETSRFSPIERRILGYFSTPHTATEIFQWGGVATGMKSLCGRYAQTLREENLLFGDDRQAQAARLGWNAATLILVFGAYKLLAALANGHNNVGFLMAMGLIGVCLLPVICGRRRLTRRGKAYVARLQQAFDLFKRQARDRQTVAVLAGHDDPRFPASPDPAVLLLALYGAPVLEGTPHAYYRQMFAQSGSSGSGCGSSSGGCGSGSSGGGCSGGGGGGCGGGGGGCGGCGGGS